MHHLRVYKYMIPDIYYTPQTFTITRIFVFNFLIFVSVISELLWIPNYHRKKSKKIDIFSGHPYTSRQVKALLLCIVHIIANSAPHTLYLYCIEGALHI
jgi:hypothetical protein